MPRFRAKPVDLVIDVRSRLEYFMGHLDGAALMPVDTLPGAIMKRSDVAQSAHIVVYCASGVRSAAAARALLSAGYRHVIDGGGIAAARKEFEP